MIKKRNLAYLLSYYCFCMFIEYGILYFIFSSDIINIFIIFDIKYTMPLDFFRCAVVHFMIHFPLTLLARRLLKDDYSLVRAAMLLSIATYTLISVSFLFTQYGPIIHFFAIPCSCLVSQVILVGVDKLFFDKKATT